jgi:hypothetical protein
MTIFEIKAFSSGTFTYHSGFKKCKQSHARRKENSCKLLGIIYYDKNGRKMCHFKHYLAIYTERFMTLSILLAIMKFLL